jgi:hypothetical protein
VKHGLAAAEALAAVAILVFVAGGCSAGFVTGVGSTRTAHLIDSPNGLEAVVVVPEALDGFRGYTFSFSLQGSNSTAPADYLVSVVISPGRDTEKKWNGSGLGPSGDSNTTISVTIGPDELEFTLANSPFAVELRDANGTLRDSALFSVDLRYREPPADGGLLALTIATVCFWGGVLLYAVYLQLAQRKLRARAQALERSLPLAPREAHDLDDKR